MNKERFVDSKIIQKLTKILEENLENERFGVSELTEAAGLSRSQLHRKVHAYNGNSTSQFIREFRLQKAMEMLKLNGLTMAEVAYKVGFSSPTYFNTCFKEYYGYSPGEAKFHDYQSQPKFNQRRKVWILSSTFLTIILIGFGIYYWSPAQKDTSLALSSETSETSIAVLPLNNWSGNPDLEYISNGMTDAIINRLTQINAISKVVPFTSVINYKNTTKSIPAISEELQVQNVLQGNVQFSGDQIKISLQLVDGSSDAHVWSHEYSGVWLSEEIFDIQTDVAESVAKNLDLEITNEEYGAIQRRPTQNKEAYNYWLKAKDQSLKYNKEGMANAVPLFEKAISLDSTFCEPYADMAYLYLFGGASWGLYTEHEAWFKAKELLIKATQLDSADHQLNSALNDGLFLYEWDFETMEKNYETNSNLGIIYCLQTGRYNEALSTINELYEEYPTDIFYPVFKAQALFYLNRRDEALDIFMNSDKFHSDQIMYLRIASRFYYYMGEYERSRALLSKLMTNFPDRPPVVLWLNAVNAYEYGENQIVNQILAELESRYHEGKSGSPAWFTALYYSSIGENEDAFKWLQKSFDKHEVEMIWLREEPALTSLRSDHRYQELYRKVGFPMPQHQN